MTLLSRVCVAGAHQLCDEDDQRVPHHCDCECHNPHKILQKIEERMGGRPVLGLSRLPYATLEGLLDLLVKDTGKTNEINILTAENRELRNRLNALQAIYSDKKVIE